MASAAVPLIAGYLGSTLVSKIGESQGWDPRFTAIASILAGAGLGSVGAGVSASAGIGASQASTATTAAANSQRLYDVAGNQLVSYKGSLWPAQEWMPFKRSLWSAQGAGGASPAMTPEAFRAVESFGMNAQPITQPSAQNAFTYAAKNAWSDTWKDEKFITSLGTTFIDGMFASPEKKEAVGGGGGGGGGGSAPAYQGGQGGQYQLLVGFPERATGPQWKEVA